MTMYKFERNRGRRGRPSSIYTRVGHGIVTAVILFLAF